MEFDPERELWVPGRRKFFLGLGALAASLILAPSLEEVLAVAPPLASPAGVALATPAWVTREVAKYFMNDIQFVRQINRHYDEARP